MLNKDTLVEWLNKESFAYKETNRAICGYDMAVMTDSSRIRDLATHMNDLDLFLSFITAIDVAPKMLAVYQFNSVTIPFRIMMKVPVDDHNSVPTISDILQGANWHEREVRDLFGIQFTGHPEMKPLILADGDSELAPLRKREALLKNIGTVFPENG